MVLKVARCGPLIVAAALALLPASHTFSSTSFFLSMPPRSSGGSLPGRAAQAGLNVCGNLLPLRREIPLGANDWGEGSRRRRNGDRVAGGAVFSSAQAEQAPNFECVKNVRDLASVGNSPVKPGRILRAACVGTASEADECVLVDTVKTLVDLRSEQEYNGDMIKYQSKIFDSYDTLFYKVEYSKSGRAKAVVPTKPVLNSGTQERGTRHLLSVIDEGIYKRGVFKKLSTRKKLKAAAYIGFSMVKARKVFLDYINAAGLPLLNELILDYGGASIRAVLEVLSNRENHPVAFYCTAGKDRTGLIAMLVLSSLGVDKESIVTDYVLSDSVYADLNDKSAMVGALQQQQLDPERFLRAPRSVMDNTMELLNKEYGGAEAYMDKIGFGPEDRARLRSALCDE